MVQIFQVKSSEAVAHMDFLGCIASEDIDIKWPLNVLNSLVVLKELGSN